MIRISVHGAAYVVLGLLLFAGGVMRGELLSAACGGLLTVYLVFAVAGLLVTFLCWKNEDPEVSVQNGTFTVIPDERKTVSGKASVFPFCAAGIAVRSVFEFSVIPSQSAETVYTLSFLLGKSRTASPETAVPRGRYFYKREYISIGDFAGFFSIRLMRNIRLYRTYTAVQPVIRSETGGIPLLRSHETRNIPAIERTAELYESRPYVPGDDPRKIHWKLYAHTRSLAVKLGAFEPPPVKELCIYIEEPIIRKKKDRLLIAPVLDAFIGRLSFLASQLLAADIRCSVIVYDYPAAASDRGGEALPMTAPQKTMQRYSISPDDKNAFDHVRTLFAVPSPYMPPEAAPDMDEVFKAVPKGGGLLYCYIPLPAETTDKVETRIAASRFAEIQTFFYLAAPPQLLQEAGKSTKKSALRNFLYCSAAGNRRNFFYRRLSLAAEQTLHRFTAKDCHAQIL